MSEKKEPGTALVPVRDEPIDLARIPDAGYAELAPVEEARSDLMRSFLKEGAKGLAFGSIWIAIILTAIQNPLLGGWPFAALVLAYFATGITAMTSAGTACVDLIRLMRQSLSDHLGRSERAELARREGRLLKGSESWNRERRRLRRAIRALERHEADVRALPDGDPDKKMKMDELYREWAKMAAVHEDLMRWRSVLDQETETLREEISGPPPGEPKRLTSPDDPDP